MRSLGCVIQHGWYPYIKRGFGHIDKEASRGSDMKMKADVRGMGLQAKGCGELSAAPEAGKRPRTHLSHSLKGANPFETLIRDFDLQSRETDHPACVLFLSFREKVTYASQKRDDRIHQVELCPGGEKEGRRVSQGGTAIKADHLLHPLPQGLPLLASSSTFRGRERGAGGRSQHFTPRAARKLEKQVSGFSSIHSGRQAQNLEEPHKVCVAVATAVPSSSPSFINMTL